MQYLEHKHLDNKQAKEWIAANDALPITVTGDLSYSRPQGWLAADATYLANVPELPTFQNEPYVLVSPPKDAVKLWNSRRSYARADLRSVIDAFDSLRATLLGEAYSGPPFQWRGAYGPRPVDGAAALKHLKTLVQQRRRTFAAIEADPPESIRVDRERKARLAAMDADARSQRHEARQQIEAITLD
jgi:hypothetical protein